MHFQKVASQMSEGLVEARVFHKKWIINVPVLDPYACAARGNIQKGGHLHHAPVLEEVLKRNVMVSGHIIHLATCTLEIPKDSEELRDFEGNLREAGLCDLKAVPIDADVVFLASSPLQKRQHFLLCIGEGIPQMQIGNDHQTISSNGSDQDFSPPLKRFKIP